MRIEPFDPLTADEATATAWADLCLELAPAWTPAGLPPTREAILTDARHIPEDRRNYYWVAYDGDAMVAGIEISWNEAPDNRNRLWLHFDAPPERCTPDVLGALAAAAADVAEPAGRTLLNVETPQGSPAGEWVASRGGTLGSVEQVNVVRFDAVDRADVAALAATAPEGYELVRFDGRVPDELVEEFVRLNQSMNDAPRDDLTMEDWTFTPERLRRYEDCIARRGHEFWTVVARHRESGEFAAFNQLVGYPEWPEVIENEDTAVTAKHRGHGLGLWVKAANLQRAMERPGARAVLTWNAASNEHMLRVNRRLGFVCEHTWESWELDVAKVR
ncbi:MAG TPA: GNAT family N-acetyltransferase [Frankiaceae bacterium]|nr:GNAT family N-acetyltransferase [Frankiaceae bacterium]